MELTPELGTCFTTRLRKEEPEIVEMLKTMLDKGMDPAEVAKVGRTCGNTWLSLAVEFAVKELVELRQA